MRTSVSDDAVSPAVTLRREATSAGALGRPRMRLQRRMLWWMFLMSTIPAVICVVVINTQVRKYLLEQRRQDSELLVQVVATSLAGRISNGWTRHAGELIDSLGNEGKQDGRVAFVAVTDAAGRPLHVGAFDPDAWDAYCRSQQSSMAHRVLDVSQPILLGAVKNMVVRNVPIISPSRRDGAKPAPRSAGSDPAATGKVEGFLVLALRDHVIFNKMDLVQSATVLTIVGACAMSLLVVAVMLRRWSAPLRGLLDGTRRLAEGQHPEPIAVTTQDEMGFLAAAFNDMASRLLGIQHHLTEANETLEQKVKARTSELQLAVIQLDDMASTDALTKLANRRAFDDVIPDLFASAKLRGTELAVAVLDLDGFKQVNDTFGHERGDQLLVMTADTIRDECGRRDVAARMGGDEFVLLMPGTDLPRARETADRIRQQFEERSRQLFDDAKDPPRVSVSIGLACLSQTQPDSSDELIAQADLAMYRAKEAGKSCLRVYEPSSGAGAKSEVA
jgi:diguanylate cyclase (GGDEF)-like protein